MCFPKVWNQRPRLFLSKCNRVVDVAPSIMKLGPEPLNIRLGRPALGILNVDKTASNLIFALRYVQTNIPMSKHPFP